MLVIIILVQIQVKTDKCDVLYQTVLLQQILQAI